MRRTVRRNKEAYATKEKVDWRFNLEGMDNPYAFTWSRGDFDPWIKPKIEQAAEIAGRVLENAKKNGLKVDQVILIGGTSNLVFVRETLASRLGIPVLQWDRCIEAVAWGAALKASEKVSKSQSPPTVNPRPPVVQDKPKRERPFYPPSKPTANYNTPNGLVQILTQPTQIGTYLLACEIPPNPPDDFFADKVIAWDIDLVLINQSATNLPSLELHLFNPANGQKVTHSITLGPCDRLLLTPLQLGFLLQEGCLLCLYDNTRDTIVAKYEITNSDFLNTSTVNRNLPQPIPLVAYWRSGFWSEGAVLHLLNLSTISLNSITVLSERGKTSAQLAIGPTEVLKIGSLELDTSQNFKGGDVFAIECLGYMPSIGEIVDSNGNSIQGGGGAKTALAAAGAVAGGILMALLGG
jgi:hypothetical protein